MYGWIDGKKDRLMSNVATNQALGKALESCRCLRLNKAAGQIESFKLYQTLSQPVCQT